MKPNVAILALTLTSTFADAHHSTRAFYDRDASIEIAGEITSMFWRNPHVGLTLRVRNEQGQEEEWELEGGTINTLRRRGFSDEMLAIGDYVRVAGAPSIRGQNALFVSNMLLPSGQEIVFTDQPRPPLWTTSPGNTASAVPIGGGTALVGESPVPNLFRVWSFGRIYRLQAPLVLTEAAAASRDAWDPVRDDPSLRCVAPGMPNAILNPYPIEFIDEGDRIRLRIEEWDAVRVIHLSDAALPENVAPSRLGYSRGRWEEDALLVETSLVDAPYLDDSGTPMSVDARIIERFSLRREAGRLDYEVTVTDPANLLEPAVWTSAWIWSPAVQVRPFDCTLR